MDQFAVFVDAGYLFAQGSALVAGAKLPRTDIALDEVPLLDRLTALGGSLAPNARLLRIYWYDAPPRGGPTLEQIQIAERPSAKLRLGFLNAANEQKGVDSLIVTDLIELARQKAICDALLLSGDEDVRVGVQVAQAYGVRAHLLGIQPSRGSQSQQLRLEADTVTEWGRDIVSTFLSRRPHPQPSTSVHAGDSITVAIEAVIATLSTDEMMALKRFCETERGLPSEQDGAALRALSSARQGAAIDENERRDLRRRFRERVLAKV